jgi:hypothetical protein
VVLCTCVQVAIAVVQHIVIDREGHVGASKHSLRHLRRCGIGIVL